MGNGNRCDVEGILFRRAVITELSYPADFISVVETFSSGWCMSTSLELSEYLLNIAKVQPDERFRNNKQQLMKKKKIAGGHNVSQ